MNTNCLENRCCPRCQQDDRFDITAASVFRLVDNGTEEHGDVEYDDDSEVDCPECGWSGKWGETYSGKQGQNDPGSRSQSAPTGKKITKAQAIQLLDTVKAVVVDEEGVCGFCFHNTYEEGDDVDDMWLEACFETSDGLAFEFEVTETEAITWDGTVLTVAHEGEELTFTPVVSSRQITEFVTLSRELLSND